MTTDNRTNEPTEAQVEAAARAYDPEAWFHHDRLREKGEKGLDGMVAYSLSKGRAALVAAQGAARPVNSFDTTAERVKTGADSLHVAPQEPNQTETKSGNNFVSLDPEKVAEVERAAAARALEEAADGIESRRNEPGLVHLDVRYAGYYTGIRSGMESDSKALRARAAEIREGKLS